MSNDRHDNRGRFASGSGSSGMKGSASVKSHIASQHRNLNPDNLKSLRFKSGRRSRDGGRLTRYSGPLEPK